MFVDSVKRDDVKVAAVERAEPKLALAVKHEGRTVAPGAPDTAQELSRVPGPNFRTGGFCRQVMSTPSTPSSEVCVHNNVYLDGIGSDNGASPPLSG